MRRLKSGASAAKWPTSSGLVAMFLAIIGIAQGHLLMPPPQFAGIGSPGLISGLAQGSPASMGPSCDRGLALGASPISLQKVEAMYSPKWYSVLPCPAMLVQR